jgi:hypothetical protein
VANKCEFVHQSDKNPLAYRELSEFSSRIAVLLESQKGASHRPLLACLDDLLGAVYSLFFAVQLGYKDRQQALASQDLAAVLKRAKDMADLKVRAEGAWTAGFYFNNALFRVAAVYHRARQVVTPQMRQNHSSKFTGLGKVTDEVNGLKHKKGVIAGRKVKFEDSLEAIAELLELLEAFKETPPSAERG